MKHWSLGVACATGVVMLAGSAAAQEASAAPGGSAPAATSAPTEPAPGAESAPPAESAEPAPPPEAAPPASDGPPPVEDVTSQPAEPTYPEASGEVEAAPTYSTPQPPTEPPKIPSPFDQGRVRLGVVLGWAQASSGFSTINWVLLGLSGGYYVLDGLEPNLGTSFWIGDPFIATVSPGLNYVFHMVPTVKPYVGGFYRHYFVTDNSFAWDDTDSIGARGGVYFMIAPMSYFGGGVAYEHFLDENLFSNVDQVYPEITISIAF